MKKVYHFKNFNHCFAFMDNVAIVAEAMDHHPEWTHYDNEVEIHLSTHDAGNRISYKDLILASAMVRLVGRSNMF
jgi:4a-hydroxytetrahydrobiopterin dehydratase